MILKIKRLSEGAILPAFSHPGDAGMDLYSNVHETIEPGKAKLIGTGLAIELPEGTEAQVRPRSGLALKSSVTVLNSPGTVDEGYRGEIGVILINHSDVPFRVEPGARIAQMVVKPVIPVVIEEVPELNNTKRGEGGFGSTGSR